MNTEKKKSARDTRKKALLITGGIVIAGGLAIAYVPDKLHISVANGSQEARAAHALEKTEAEIRQRFEQGVAMLNDKQYENALTAFHRVLELAPKLPEAHVNTGYALLGLERYAAARDFFESAINLRKDQLNAYYGLAEALEGMKDYPGALGAMRTYLHLAPPNDPYRRKAEAAVWEWGARVEQKSQKREKAVPGKQAN